MATLYRKYRPAIFSDVVGQETTVQTIQNEIAMDKLAHAYLFSGPRGVGKTTLARLLAKAASCEKRKKSTFEPCNECSACTQINNGRHIDIIEIDAASQTGVDNVRENIIENAGVMPTTLKHKIFIIDEVHMLSTSAFNALLKTLEEPPEHVIFILATTEFHKLPATVVSRCQRFNFKKIPFEKMQERLKKICSEEKIKVDKAVLERIIRKSEGGLRDAESLLGQILSLNLREVTEKDIQMILPLSSAEALIEYLKKLIENNPGAAIAIINTQAEEGTNLDQFAHDLLEMLRAMLLFAMHAEDTEARADYSEENIKEMRKMSAVIASDKLVAILDLTLKRRAEIKYSPIPQLPLELLAVEVAQLLSSTDGNTPFEGGGGNGGRQETRNKEAYAEATADRQKTSEPATPASLTGSSLTLASIQSPGTPDNNFKFPISNSENADKKSDEQKEKANLGTIANITNTIKTAFTGETKTTLDQIKSKWDEIVEKSATVIPSLIFILKMCTLEDLKGNTIVVGVPYSLHKEKMEATKNRVTMENCLESIFSERLHLSYVVVQQERPAEPDISDLAAEFGGEVMG